MADVTFRGAAGSVTGSSTLLGWGETRILVDCGLFQGDEALEQLNWAPFAFSPASLDAVVVTHAHLDHTGLLPRLVAQNYKGPVYCTRASRGLISLVLEDSGELQEEEVRFARRKGYSRHPDPKPLYTAQDARRVLGRLIGLSFEEEREILPGIRLRFRRAGHLLGAASVELSAKGADGERRTWCFSGDLGRYGVPILKDPDPPKTAPAALVLESTYGDRLHAPEKAAEQLREAVRDTFARGGSVIVPAFALGRTQDVLYHLSAMVDDGTVDADDVFLDSPMAIEATDLYERARSEHDEDLAELVAEGLSPLGADRFRRCRTSSESKALNSRREPAVIVAASGMATGGRVVHHLAQRLGDPRTTVLFVGYQASGTRGRHLVEGAQRVAIHGRQVQVRAEIRYLRSLSAHGDRDELLRWCQDFPAPPQRIFLNHGEDPARKCLEAALVEIGWPRPELPTIGTRVPW